LVLHSLIQQSLKIYIIVGSINQLWGLSQSSLKNNNWALSYFGRPITKYYETLNTHPKIEVCSPHLELYWFPLARLDGSESSTLGKGYGIKCSAIGNILGNKLGT
jgi:hypothetical protein